MSDDLQQRLMFEITAKEMQLLLEMRKYEYGNFLIGKAKGRLTILETKSKVLLQDELRVPYSE